MKTGDCLNGSVTPRLKDVKDRQYKQTNKTKMDAWVDIFLDIFL
jgi:hypothetical protein